MGIGEQRAARREFPERQGARTRVRVVARLIASIYPKLAQVEEDAEAEVAWLTYWRICFS